MVQDGLKQETGHGMVSSLWGVINPQGLQKNASHTALKGVRVCRCNYFSFRFIVPEVKKKKKSFLLDSTTLCTWQNAINKSDENWIHTFIEYILRAQQEIILNFTSLKRFKWTVHSVHSVQSFPSSFFSKFTSSSLNLVPTNQICGLSLKLIQFRIYFTCWCLH